MQAITRGAYEGANKYTIYGDEKKKLKLFKTKEKTGCLWRCCCGEHRPFEMKVRA